MKALAIAATGMNAQQLNLEVIANNVANINTTGFKRARAEFSDLLYQVERNSGVPNASNQAIVPEGAHVGLGVQTSAVRNLHIQGSLVGTSNKLDMALVGRGWFQIESPDGETQYTRAGAFNTNADGQLVTIDGYMSSFQVSLSPMRPAKSSDFPYRADPGPHWR
jgi:flagellar basal-body rod protein FlgG